MEEIQLHCSYRRSQGAEYFVSRQGTVSKIGIGSLKPLVNGCVLFSLNIAEGKFCPSAFENKI